MGPHRTTFARKADAIWKSRYFGGVIIALAALACTYWLFRVPAPGTAVTVLAAAAAIMAFRVDSGGVEKSAFMLVLFGLLYVEFSAIRKAAREQNEQFNASIAKQEN